MADEEQKPKDVVKLLTFTLIAANLVVMFLGSYLVYSSTIGYKTPISSDEQLQKELKEFRRSLKTEAVVYTMDTFNTNLNGIPRRLIRLTVNLEMLDEEGFEEVIALGAEARDSVIQLINSKRLSDIETVQGKLHLKNQIISQVNSFLERGVVQNVYFSDFAVQ
jgi:flagellar FliL protein